jgi:hypothetical protein
MKNKNADKLDTRLQQWGARALLDETRRRELEMRIMRNTRECLHVQANAATADNGSWLHWPGLVGWATLGSLAAVLVLLAVTLPRSANTVPPPSVAQDHTLALPFSPEQIAARKLIFGELDDLFAGTLRWVKLQNGQFQFDFGTEPVHTKEEPVALRTVVSILSPETEEWVPVWNTDILLPTEEYVSLAKPDHPETLLGLWVHRLPDGGYIVQADIRDAGKSSASQMLQFLAGSGTTESACLNTGETQYRISQSMAVLTEGAG